MMLWVVRMTTSSLMLLITMTKRCNPLILLAWRMSLSSSKINSFKTLLKEETAKYSRITKE